MALPSLPLTLHAAQQYWPTFAERNPFSPYKGEEIEYFNKVCGAHIGFTQRAATALAALRTIGISELQAARHVARLLRDEARASKKHAEANWAAMDDYPTRDDIERVQETQALAERLDGLYLWLAQQCCDPT